MYFCFATIFMTAKLFNQAILQQLHYMVWKYYHIFPFRNYFNGTTFKLMEPYLVVACRLNIFGNHYSILSIYLFRYGVYFMKFINSNLIELFICKMIWLRSFVI